MNPKLANPLKMRLIAETFTKTDKIDATTHAIILRAGLTPLVHVPPKEVREQKNLLRQRVWLVKLQTMLKNRIHNVLDRNHLTQPERTDIFGSHGRAWMNALDLRDPDGKLLKADLELLDTLRAHIRRTEKWIDEALKAVLAGLYRHIDPPMLDALQLVLPLDVRAVVQAALAELREEPVPSAAGASGRSRPAAKLDEGPSGE